jgi:hypothetical protein
VHACRRSCRRHRRAAHVTATAAPCLPPHSPLLSFLPRLPRSLCLSRVLRVPARETSAAHRLLRLPCLPYLA